MTAAIGNTARGMATPSGAIAIMLPQNGENSRANGAGQRKAQRYVNPEIQKIASEVGMGSLYPDVGDLESGTPARAPARLRQPQPGGREAARGVAGGAHARAAGQGEGVRCLRPQATVGIAILVHAERALPPAAGNGGHCDPGPC